MANLLRSAKSGGDWTINELVAYNIQVEEQSACDFFGALLSSTNSKLDPVLLSRDYTLDQHTSDDTYRLLELLELATISNAGIESAIDDFARATLQILKFEEKEYRLILRSRYSIPFTICGDSDRSAQTDLCLVQGGSTILLLLHEDKTLASRRDPEPQVIAEAIAAYQYNQRILSKKLNMTIPCITMTGTRPAFHSVPVTKELSRAVATGQYPVMPTKVYKCSVPFVARQLSEGMRDLAYRKTALQYFEAFKILAKTYWLELIV